MTTNDKQSPATRQTLEYASAPVRPPRPKPTPEELDRRERIAAFWILGMVVVLPFLLIAWFFLTVHAWV